MHVQEMYRRLTGLVVFRRLLQDPVVAACGEMLSARVRGDSGDFSALPPVQITKKHVDSPYIFLRFSADFPRKPL